MRRALVVLLIAACSSSSPKTTPAKAAPRGPSCPATFAAAKGACTEPIDCSYPEGTCRCAKAAWCNGMPPGPDWAARGPTWECRPAVGPDGCPGVEPAQGTACSAEGKRCDFTCACMEAAVCTHGVWTIEHGACKPAAPPRR